MALLSLSPAAEAQVDRMQSEFLNPPSEARPQVWWHWMNGNITRDGIYKDITWMHRVGLSGFHVFDAGIGTPQIVEKRITYMTPEWKECLRYSLHLADSLGMSVTIPSSPGWSNTGGPWVTRRDAMKKIVWSTRTIQGGSQYDGPLPEAIKTTGVYQDTRTGAWADSVLYEDIAVIAVRQPKGALSLLEMKPTVYGSDGTKLDLAPLTDCLIEGKQRVYQDKSGKVWIAADFGKPVTLSAVSFADYEIRYNDWNYGDRSKLCDIEASDDGENYRHIYTVPLGRCVLQTADFPATTARYFRVVYLRQHGDNKGAYCDVAELNYYTNPRVNLADEKAGFTAFGDVSRYPTPSNAVGAKKGDVIDLSDKVDASGQLHWRAPRGLWRIYRFGSSLMGVTNHPASPEATGLEVDKLSREAVGRYLGHYLDMYKDASGGDMGKNGIGYLLIDSYEAGKQTWTPLMRSEFTRRRGYDPLLWLPTIAGEVIGSADESDRFLFDWRKTIGELLEDNLYGQAAEMAHKRGMQTYFEADENGRVYLADGMTVKKHADIPMGAMWAYGGGSVHGYMTDIHESASAAHVYGKRFVAGESFTAEGINGREHTYYPGNLKDVADRMMSNGLNRFIIHESAMQPDDTHVPGLTLGMYGQWFNRHETWAEMARPWTDYLGRSCYMLQSGTYAADIAYFYGQDDCLTGLYCVNLPKIPKEYAFDYINDDALIHSLTFDGKLLHATGGTTYSLLALDPNCRVLSVPAMRKIAELAEQGCPIWGTIPTVNASLSDKTSEFERLRSRILKSGKVISAPTLADALAKIGLGADLRSADMDSLDFVHRHMSDGRGEVYWVRTTASAPLQTTVSLRVSGLEPEIWHPEDGRIEKAAYTMHDGRTDVRLSLTPHDAVFIVLRHATSATSYSPATRSARQLTALDGAWDVSFPSGYGAPATARFEKLISLSESPVREIRYYSGTTEYTKEFSIASLDKAAGYRLNLGKVGCMAEVTVNGKTLGTLWKAPYSIDITPALQSGKNTLRVKVVNLWPNRIIGDLQSDAPRKYTWSSFCGFKADSPLLPSGLMGPVTIDELR